MTNRYPGKCGQCSGWVEAGAGTCARVGGRFVVSHTGPCPAPRPARVKAEPGAYRKDGRIYVVRERKFRDSPEPVRYAREVVAVSETTSDRLAEDGSKARYEEAPDRGMVWELTEADALPLADFQALCQSYGSCIACGTTLRKAESIAAKIGPVCGGRQARLDKAREARRLAEVVPA